MSPRELELKLELTAKELRWLKAIDGIESFVLAPAEKTTLRSIYFDTREQKLRQAGIALRIRLDGKAWVQTVKSGVGVSNGVSHPHQLEVPVAGPAPNIDAIADPAIAARVRHLVDGSDLKAAFEVVVDRTTRRLRAPDGEVELALDEGIVRAGNVARPFREAELELKSGDATCLLAAALKLFAGMRLRMSSKSKAERGYALASPDRPRRRGTRSSQVRLTPGFTGSQALALFVRSAETQIRNARSILLKSDEPEGAHQLRIGLRRLRSALKDFRPFFDTQQTRSFDRQAQALARTVGELRDIDILLADICAPVAKRAGELAGMQPLMQRLRDERLEKRDGVRRALKGDSWSILELYFSLWPHTLNDHGALGWPVEKIAAKALHQSWKRAAHLGKRLRELTPKQRHDMRKALKQFRYAIEFFDPLYGARKVRSMTKQLKELQNVFGYLNDVAVARQLKPISSRQSRENGACQQAATFVLGWHSAQSEAMWEKANSLWRRLNRKRNIFW